MCRHVLILESEFELPTLGACAHVLRHVLAPPIVWQLRLCDFKIPQQRSDSSCHKGLVP